MSGSVLKEIFLKLYNCKVCLCEFWDLLVPRINPGSLKVLLVELSSFLCSELSLSSMIASPAKKFTDVWEM